MIGIERTSASFVLLFCFMTNSNFEPDIFDLNDWLVMKHPKFFSTIKYLHAAAFYAAALKYWKEQGSPEIKEVE